MVTRLLDFVTAEKRSAILYFGGGGERFAVLLAEARYLHVAVENSGSAIVACYPLTPRVTDIFVARGLEDVVQPAATMLLMNEGRADTTRPAARHSPISHTIRLSGRWSRAGRRWSGCLRWIAK